MIPDVEGGSNMCPKCSSSFLLIKHKTVSERFLIAMTGKRKYCCQDCGAYFRAQDRRKLAREASVAAALASAHGTMSTMK